MNHRPYRQTPAFTVTIDFDAGALLAPFMAADSGDVDIRRGDVPEHLSDDGHGAATLNGPNLEIRDRRVLLKVPNGLRFLVEGGNVIRYDVVGDRCSANGVSDAEIASFLLGPVWGILCYQRGLLPLHASAIILDNGDVYAFAGASGSGKSTLIAGLAARGYHVFSDDILILDPSGTSPRTKCYAGSQQVKLWSDAVKLTTARAKAPVRNITGFDKFYVEATNPSAHPAVAGALAGLFLIPHETLATAPSIERVDGPTAVSQWLGALYRPRIGSATLGRLALVAQAAALQKRVPLYHFRRRLSVPDYANGMDTIERWIRNNG